MRYLLISLCLLLASCGSYPAKRNLQPVKNLETTVVNPFFSQEAEDYIYKADITFRDRDLGGLFIVKKLGETHHRIVFTTEMGNKIFDISLDDRGYKVNYILEQLDKKPLLNLLWRDFRVLTQEKADITKTYTDGTNTVLETVLNNKKHYYHTDKGILNKIVRANNAKEQAVFLFSDISDNSAGKIRIIHKTIKLNINLKAIH